MKIAFNPSTVEALITPPNNKDITFDLRGHNIFARGVKFCGTDTNTWRDIKINNVSIGSNILDLRNGDNTTLINTDGVVTINSTWRPVVDNLTSDSTTSSLSANLGKVLKALIDDKSDSEHTHDDRYLRLTGGWMSGDINFGGDNRICWGRNTDSASISFKNDGDYDADSYMSFVTSDNCNEYFRWSHSFGSTNTEWMALRGDGLRVGGTKVSLEGHSHNDLYYTKTEVNNKLNGKSDSGHNHDDQYLKLTGGTMTGNIILSQSTTIIKPLRSTYNYDTVVSWSVDGETKKYGREIGLYNMGGSDSTGSITIVPYKTDTEPWLGTVGLFIAKNTLKLDDKPIALKSDIPSSLKNPYSFNVFGVIYDGSAAKVVGPSNFISLLKEGTSIVTDGTMFVTSVNSDSGFADTSYVNVPYKRKAIHLWEYIKAKTDSFYAVIGHNHDSRYVRYYAVTTLDCNNLAPGLTVVKNSATNSAVVNHSAYLYISDVGTPFQIQIPDSNTPYIFKRNYSSGTWSEWFKLNAGYADSAGSVAWDNIAGKPSTFAPSSHTHDDRYIKKIGDMPTNAYDLIITPTNLDGKHVINPGGGIHVKANTGTPFQLWLQDTSNVWYKKTHNGDWVKMDAGNADTVDGYHADNIQSAGWRNLYRTGGSSNVIKWTRIGRCISNAGDNPQNDGMIEFHTNGDQNYKYFGYGRLQISQYGQSSKSLMLYSFTSEGIHFYATIDEDNYIWLGHNAWWSGNSAYRVIWSGSYIEWYSSGMNMLTSNPNSVYVTDNGTFKKPNEIGFVCLNNVSVGNSDKVDGYHASDLVKFYLSPMDNDAPADSAKSWFTNTMPSGSGAIVYNVPGSEKTIIAGKSSGAFGHMLQLNYDDTYLRILRYYNSSWKSTNWEKISAGYADSAGSVAWDNVTGKPSSFTPSSHTHSWTSITDKLVAGNEFNIVNAGYNDNLWFNYLPINDRSKTASIHTYIMCNGAKGMASVTASGFIKNGSSSSYVLLGDGGHQTISSLSVNYANSAGNADTVDGYHATSGNDKPWGTIPVIHTNGWMDIGKQLEFHFDNTTGSDYSTILRCTGNYSNNVYLPSSSGTLALTSEIPTTLPANGGNADTVDGVHANGLLTALSNSDKGISITVGGTTKSVSNISVNYASSAGKLASLGNYTYDNLSTDIPTNAVSYRIIESGGTDLGDSQYNVLHIPWKDGDFGAYLLFGANNGRFGVKHKHSGVVREVLDSSNYTSYAIPTSASCNKNWSYSGQSDQPSWLWGTNDGTNCYVWNPSNFSVNYANSANTSNRTKFLEIFRQDSTTDTYGTSYPIWAQWANSTNVRLKCTNYTVWTDKADYADSAGSVAKLQTARKIWGQSFDGTADVDGMFSGSKGMKINGVWIGLNTNSESRNQTIDCDGNDNLYLNYYRAKHVITNIAGGNLGVGIANPTYKLHVAGDIYSTEYVRASSGFVKGSLTNDYVLLGGGGHKLESDLNVANADTVDGEHASNFVRAGVYDSADLNKLDTYSFIKSVNSTVASASPKGNTGWYNVILLVHRNGNGDGPGYIGQIALGMTTNIDDMFFRSSRTDPWKTVLHDGNSSISGNTIKINNTSLTVANSNHNHDNVYLKLTGGTMLDLSRIGVNGDLYIGDVNNNGWLYFQDIASLDGTDYWSISTDGSAEFEDISTRSDVNIGGLIYRDGIDSSWVKGRDNALLRDTSSNGYHPLWSLKTTNGSWEFGEYNHTEWNNIPVLNYITDTNYNSGNNTPTYQIKFPLASGTVALTSNIPNPTNYYWANVKISSTTNSMTLPLFYSVKAYLYSLTNADGSGSYNLAYLYDNIINIGSNSLVMHINASNILFYANSTLCIDINTQGHIGIGKTASLSALLTVSSITELTTLKLLVDGEFRLQPVCVACGKVIDPISSTNLNVSSSLNITATYTNNHYRINLDNLKSSMLSQNNVYAQITPITKYVSYRTEAIKDGSYIYLDVYCNARTSFYFCVWAY